jgi:hypothetical protein
LNFLQRLTIASGTLLGAKNAADFATLREAMHFEQFPDMVLPSIISDICARIWSMKDSAADDDMFASGLGKTMGSRSSLGMVLGFVRLSGKVMFRTGS